MTIIIINGILVSAGTLATLAELFLRYLDGDDPVQDDAMREHALRRLGHGGPDRVAAHHVGLHRPAVSGEVAGLGDALGAGVRRDVGMCVCSGM